MHGAEAAKRQWPGITMNATCAYENPAHSLYKKYTRNKIEIFIHLVGTSFCEFALCVPYRKHTVVELRYLSVLQVLWLKQQLGIFSQRRTESKAPIGDGL